MKTKWLFAAVLMTVLSSAVATVQIQNAKAATTRNFTLYGSILNGWGFTDSSMSNPGPPIVVEQGDTVNLTLISNDGITHRFFVSYTNQTSPSAGDPESPVFTSAGVNFQFVASNTIGTYQYHCAIHPQMMGYFQIVPAGSIPEFQPLTMLLLLVASTTIAALAYKRKKQT
jgi:plastocyanin